MKTTLKSIRQSLKEGTWYDATVPGGHGPVRVRIRRVYSMGFYVVNDVLGEVKFYWGKASQVNVELDGSIVNGGRTPVVLTPVRDEDAGWPENGWRWNRHTNQLGDYCPWSGGKADETETGPEATCPAGCPYSQPVEDNADYGTVVPPAVVKKAENHWGIAIGDGE